MRRLPAAVANVVAAVVLVLGPAFASERRAAVPSMF